MPAAVLFATLLRVTYTRSPVKMTLGFGLVLATVAAQAASAALNRNAVNAAIIKNAARTLAVDCSARGGRPGNMRAAITTADLTGDGLVEWFINGAAYRCDGGADPSGLAGNGGMPFDIESGQPDGRSRQVFGERVFDLKLELSGTRAVAWVQVGGRYCGQTSLPMGANAWSCELPLRWNAAARKLQIAPPSAAHNLVKTD